MSEGDPGPAPRIVLASRSPQRRALLTRLGLDFEVRPADVQERRQGDPHEVAAQNALAKARAARRASERHASGAPELIIGVDTVVALDGVLYGKPPDARRARDTLARLGGRTHQVVSGLALLQDGEEQQATAATTVSFRTLPASLLDWYVATGEWRGRAGGYAIQGSAAALVRAIEGDYENVVGLPLALLLDLRPGLLGH